MGLLYLIIQIQMVIVLQFTKINSQEDHQQQQHLDINTLSKDEIINKCCDFSMINGVIISIKYMGLNKSIEIDI